MSKKLTILVDVDNVLEDLHTPWVNAINAKYGTNVKPDDIKSWGIESYFPTLSRTQVFSPLHKEQFWKNMKPMHDALYYLADLIADGHKLYVVTSSHPDTVKYKYDFLRRYYEPVFSYNDIIIAHDKQMVKGDVLIDDAPHNLEGGNYKGLLMDSPHNRTYDETVHGFKRVHNWKEIYEAICEIAGKE